MSIDLEERANEILRAAGHDELCRKELLQTPTEFIAGAADEGGTQLVGYHGPYGATFRKMPNPVIYQPVAKPPSAARTKGPPCPNCGKPKAKASVNLESVCAACYRARAVENHKKKLEKVSARRDVFVEQFSCWELPSGSLVERATRDHSIELTEIISELEDEYGCPFVYWSENWIGVEPVEPLSEVEVETLLRAWNNARVVYFGWRSGVIERRRELGIKAAETMRPAV
jgi:hypothetical protein